MMFVRMVGAAAAVLGLCAGTVHAQVKWDMPTAYPVSNFHSVNAQKFADGVKAATNGKLDIVVHAGASLFKAPEIKRAVQTGQAQIGEVLMVTMANEDPLFGVDGVPFLATDYDEAKALDEAARPLIEKRLQAQGLRLLYTVPWPPQGIYTNRELRSVSDMEGLRWRAYSPQTNRIGELVKAQPVTVQAAELSQALATGRVNATMTSGATGVDSKMWEQIKFFYDAQAWLPKNMVVVNSAAFEQLDENIRAAVLDQAAKAEAAGWEESRKVTRNTVETLAKNGMKVITPDPAFKAELAEIGRVMTEEWLQQAGQDGQALIQAYRR